MISPTAPRACSQHFSEAFADYFVHSFYKPICPGVSHANGAMVGSNAVQVRRELPLELFT